MPQGLNNVDVITDRDSAQSWSFTLPRLKGKPVEAGKSYNVAGWAPVSEDAAKAGNKPVWDVVETWLKGQGGRVKARSVNAPKLVGVTGNPGMAG